MIDSHLSAVFFHNPVNRIRVQMTTQITIAPYWPEERSIKIITVSSNVEVMPNPLCCLLVDGNNSFSTPFSFEPQRRKPRVHIEASDL